MSQSCSIFRAIAFKLLLSTLIISNVTGQYLSINTMNGENYMCPLSLRSFDAGYFPPHTNLLNENYELHDLRPLTWICNPADSVLSSAEKPILLITREWPCLYSATSIKPGTVVLMEVDSNEISGAKIGSFDNNSERFGPAYVIATSRQCISELYPQISSIESVEFIPDGQPVYWNRGTYPTYFVSETMDLQLPCVQDTEFHVAITLLPGMNLEMKVEDDQESDFNFSWMTFGHGLVDRRSKRYDPVQNGSDLVYNVSSGTIGDLIQIEPRCSGVDSFDLSIMIEPVDITDSCMLKTNYPFEVAKSLDTTNSVQAGGQYILTIPLSNTPISFISEADDLKELPNRDPQGRHKSYYVYDDFMFDLVIGSQGACDQLNFDLNGGFPSSTSSPIDQTSQSEKCHLVSFHEGYSCSTHATAEVIMLSDYFTLELLLPHLLDVAHCKGGDQNQIVPAIR